VSSAAATVPELVQGLPALGERRALGLRRRHGAVWWSYGRVHAESARFAALLAGRGVGRGDRVALWAANGPEWAAAAFGALLQGAVVVPVDADASPAAAARIVDEVEAVLVLHDRELDDASLGVAAVSLFTAERPPDGAGSGAVAVLPDDPAFVLFTSGSTRGPHGVVLTHRNLMSQVGSFRRWRPLTRRHAFRLLSLSPLSHVQGLLMGLVAPLSLGLGVLYSDSVEPARVIRTIRQNRIHLLLAVPRVQGVLADALRHGPYGRRGRPTADEVAGVRFFPLRRHRLFLATRRALGYRFGALLVGGATLAPEDERFWFECGYVLAQGYGLTEASALVSVHVNNPLGARLGSVGRPLGHQELRIADDGEVLVRGPNVSVPDGARGGFLRTGDLGRLDRRGRLWLHGRKSELIVTAEGRNVHARDVEATLRAVPGVRDAVVGDAGERGQVHAVLLLEGGTEAAAAVASANASLEPHERVLSWSVWPEPDLPRSALSKVRREEVLRALPSPGAFVEAVPGLEQVRAEGDRRRRLELLARHVVAPGETGDDGARIEDFGLASLDAVELAALVEGLAARPVPALEVTPRTTVAELRRKLAGPAVGRSPLPTAQPRWSPTVPGRGLRLATRPVLVGSWAHLAARVTAERPAALPTPCVLAAAPHRHWLDALAVQAALPAGTRTITVTNRDFAEWFAPSPAVTRTTRWTVGLAYHMLWPLLFEFAIVPPFGSTREGLDELGRALDRGLTAISFPKGLAGPDRPNPVHGTGVALLAVQSATPVVPVWIDGNDELAVLPRRPRPRLTVRFGDVVEVDGRTEPDDIVARVEAAYAALGGGRW
jgi:long-chain acyl-CoA synthetase